MKQPVVLLINRNRAVGQYEGVVERLRTADISNSNMLGFVFMCSPDNRVKPEGKVEDESNIGNYTAFREPLLDMLWDGSRQIALNGTQLQ